MTKRARLTIDLEVRFVPIADDEIGAWRAGVCLLLQLLREVRDEIERDHPLLVLPQPDSDATSEHHNGVDIELPDYLSVGQSLVV